MFCGIMQLLEVLKILNYVYIYISIHIHLPYIYVYMHVRSGLCPSNEAIGFTVILTNDQNSALRSAVPEIAC